MKLPIRLVVRILLVSLALWVGVYLMTPTHPPNAGETLVLVLIVFLGDRTIAWAWKRWRSKGTAEKVAPATNLRTPPLPPPSDDAKSVGEHRE